MLANISIPCLAQVRAWQKMARLGHRVCSVRFQEDISDMKFDFGLPASATSEQVHEACMQNIEVWSVTEASCRNSACAIDVKQHGF